MPSKGEMVLAELNYLPHRGAAGGDDVATVPSLSGSQTAGN